MHSLREDIRQLVFNADVSEGVMHLCMLVIREAKPEEPMQASEDPLPGSEDAPYASVLHREVAAFGLLHFEVIIVV